MRRMLTIARAEAFRTGGSFNKRTSAILLVIGLAMAFVVPHVTAGGLSFDRGLYRAAIDPGAKLLPAVEGSRLFQIALTTDPMSELVAGRADIAIVLTAGPNGGGAQEQIFRAEGPKGEAAVAAVKQAARDYTFTNLALESDQAAAFPVRVDVRYQAQQASGAPPLVPPTNPVLTAPTQTAGSAGGTTTGTGAGASAGAGAGGSTSSGYSLLPPERSINTPETLSPPFPFRSLVLAYLFLIPMNFVVQVYAGSAIGERLQRRGEAMLATPARPWEIIAGKALPYFLLMMGVSVAITYFIGGGWLTLLAIAPLALAFLALEFVAAMFARSFRELTFLTVFTSVLLTIYAFLPAVFTSVHPIALISPIALVVLDLRHDPVTLGQILYATMPLTLFSGMLFLLGSALYREEDLFHQKPVLAKMVDAVARQVKGMASGIKLSFLLIPLVFVFELLLITFLFAWPVNAGLLGILLVVALVEESFKALPSYAGLRRGRVPLQKAAIFGGLVGLGFFLAEKAFLLASLVGLMDVPAASAVLGPSLAGAPAYAWPLLLLFPLVLHVATASFTGWAAAKSDRRNFALAFMAAIMVHTLYNLTVVRLTGGLS